MKVNNLTPGLYWVKHKNEWIIAQYFDDVNAFVRYNGAYRMEPNEVTIGSRIEEPRA